MSSCNGVGKESSVTSGSNLNDQIPLLYIKQEPLDDYESQASQNNSAHNQVIPIIDIENIKKEPTPEPNCSSRVIPVYTIDDDSNEANESCAAKLSKQNEILNFQLPSGISKKLKPISSVAPPYTRLSTSSQPVQNALKNVNLRPLGSNYNGPRNPHVQNSQPLNPKEVNSTSNYKIVRNGNNSSIDINYREHLSTSNGTTQHSFGQRLPNIGQFTSFRNFSGVRSLHSVPNKIIQNQTQNRVFNHNVQSLNSLIGPSNIDAQQGETARNFATRQDQGVKNLINSSRPPIGIPNNSARTEQNKGLDSSAASQGQVKQASIAEDLNVPSFSSASSVPGNQLSTSNSVVVPPTNVSSSGSSARRKIAKKKIRRIGTHDSTRNEESQSTNERRLGSNAVPSTTINATNDSSHLNNNLQHNGAGSASDQSKLPTALENFNDHSERSIGKSLTTVSEDSSEAVKLAVSLKRKNSSPKVSPSLKKSESSSELIGQSSPEKSQNTVNASKQFTNSPISLPTNLVFENSTSSELQNVELTDCSTVENKEVSAKKTSKESSRKSQKPRRIQKSVFDAQTRISNISSPAQTCSPPCNNSFESANHPSTSESFALDACTNAADEVVVESVAFRSQSGSVNPVTSADRKSGQMSEKTDSPNNFSYREQFEKISSASEDSASFVSPSVSPSLLNTTIGKNLSINLMQNMGNNLGSEQNNASDQRNCKSSLTNNYTKTSETSNMDPFLPGDEPITFFRHKIRDFETNLSETLNSQEILRQLMPGNDKSSFGKEKDFPSNPSLNNQSTDLDSIPETNNLLCSESIAKYLLSSRQENCENEFSTPRPSTVQNGIENDLSQLFDERNDAMIVDSYQDCNSQIQTNITNRAEQIASNSCVISQCEGSFNGDAGPRSERSSVSHAEILQNSEGLASNSRSKNNEMNGLTNTNGGNNFPNFSVNLHCLSEKCDCWYTQDDSKYYSFNLGIQFLIRNNSLLTHVVNDSSTSSLNNVFDAVKQGSFQIDEQFYERCKNFEIHSSHGLSDFKLIILEMRGYSSSGFECRPLNKDETVCECENFWLSFEILQLPDVKSLFELIEYSKSINFETSPSVLKTSARSSSVPETSERTHKPNSILYFWPAEAYASNSDIPGPPEDCTSFLPAQPGNVETVTEAKSIIFIVFTNLTVIDLSRVISIDPKFADLFGRKPTVPEDNVVSFVDDLSSNTAHTEMQMTDNPGFLNETVAPQNSLPSFYSWQNETNLVSSEGLLNYAEIDTDEIVILEEIPNTSNLSRERTNTSNLSRERTSMEKFSRLENSKTNWSINNYSVTRGSQNSGGSAVAGSSHYSTSVNLDRNINLDNGVNSSTHQQQYHPQSRSNDDANRIGENAFFHQLSVIPEIRGESLEPINNRGTLNEPISNKQGSSQPTFSYDHHQQIPRYRNDNSANASAQDISQTVNNPHFSLHSSQTGAKCNTNESTTLIGNSTWNQNSYNDGQFRSFHFQELGTAHASSTHQPLGLTPENRQIPFGMVRQIPNPNLIPSHQTETYSDDINQHRIIGQLERYVDRYEQNLQLRNPQWSINMRCEPVRAHSNHRGGAHLRSTSRQGNDRSFLQTSGGNIVREEMDRHSVYRNVNNDFNSRFPDQDTAINYSLIGEGTRHIPSCPPTNFSQSFNQDYSGRPSRGVVNNPVFGQFQTHIDSPHPNPPLSNESLFALQREEESPQSNSETQSLSPPYSVVHDLSINESCNIPEAGNLYAKSPSLQKRQTSTNFSTPDSGNFSNSETEMPHETVSRFRRHSNARISSNMQSVNPVGVDDQTVLINEINRSIYDKNEDKLCELLHITLKLNNNPQFLRIKAHLALFNGQYDEVIQIIKDSPEKFPLGLHKELQMIWLQAWESLESKKFQEHPKPKTKEKHPFPETIYVDTQKVLNDAYERDQYPKLPMRQHIADLIGISEKQVCNWFKNRRQREKRKASATQDTCPRRGGRRGRKRNTPPEPEYMTSFATTSQSLPVFPGIQNTDPFNVASCSQNPHSA
ncbi:hypothetical protein AVEN_143501-1 [Araneus ventricosus]|uniref:Homeobox domain-containing protein n=1 Tax=Araneus ventricosus TaxID=182803 RepID=A0A4Y2KMD9_ARAVE|nr:hypothetical protein AVEN_143501-1 [Araneus ventricosus]